MNQNGKAAKIQRQFMQELDIVTVSRAMFKKYYMTIHPGGDKSPSAMFEKIAQFMQEHNTSILHQNVFGPCSLYKEGMESLAALCGDITWPVSWIEGDGGSATELTGSQLHIVENTKVDPVVVDGRMVGSVFEDEYMRYCYLADIKSCNTALTRPEQARKTFENIEQALDKAGMDFSNVVRTWLYINQILEWYDDFNTVRTGFFKKRNVFNNLVPASTGIGVCNPQNEAVIANVLAFQKKKDFVNIRPVPSPLQCPALDYKSSFSRAVKVDFPDHQRLYVSGTASIYPDGQTAFVGDIDKQIDLTMQVVLAILNDNDMNWSDVVRADAYFKDMNDIPAFRHYCQKKNLPPLPIAIAHADICRDDLLFEIEVDAFKS